MWEWNAPVAGGNWSNSADWLLNGAAVPPAQWGSYPGMPGSTNDNVFFDKNTAGPATLDVPIITNPINTLSFVGWSGGAILNTLTLNNSLVVSGGGYFNLADGSTITMAANTALTLWNLNTSSWYSGTINGATASRLCVVGTELHVTNSPVGGGPWILGTNMYIQTASNGRNGSMTLNFMTGNLLVTSDATIDIGQGCDLFLYQDISAAGRQGLDGGITEAVSSSPLVQVEPGGNLMRIGSSSLPGIINRVDIDGAVYNVGGTVNVPYALLNIGLADTNGYAYWQKDSSTALLKIGECQSLGDHHLRRGCGHVPDRPGHGTVDGAERRHGRRTRRRRTELRLR